MKSALLLVYPAYGRRYLTPEAMAAGFAEGKDFAPTAKGGPYLSIRDFVRGDHTFAPAYEAVSNFTGVVLTQLSPKGARVEFQTTILREEMQWPPKI